MPAKRFIILVAALVLATVACNLVLLERTLVFSNFYYTFLDWNLFLAWVPFLAAALANHLSIRHKNPTPAIIISLLIWFLFFPNAPYLITDFLHLTGVNQQRLMFDIVTIFSFASTGLVLGFASLELAQSVVKKYYGRYIGWFFALSCLGIGSFGVYLGRFLRWNSWEVLTHPISLARDMLGTIVNPLIYTRVTLSFTVILTIFCTSLYLVYRSLSAPQ